MKRSEGKRTPIITSETKTPSIAPLLDNIFSENSEYK